MYRPVVCLAFVSTLVLTVCVMFLALGDVLDGIGYAIEYIYKLLLGRVMDAEIFQKDFSVKIHELHTLPVRKHNTYDFICGLINRRKCQAALTSGPWACRCLPYFLSQSCWR